MAKAQSALWNWAAFFGRCDALAGMLYTPQGYLYPWGLFLSNQMVL